MVGTKSNSGTTKGLITYSVNIDDSTIKIGDVGQTNAGKLYAVKQGTPYSLTIGSITFDGSAAKTVNAGNGIEFDPASGASNTIAIKAKTTGYITAGTDGINIDSSKVDSAYTTNTTNIATVATVTAALGTLNVSNITGFDAGKTLATLTETDGKIAATFQNISITTSQISDASTSLVTSVKGDGTYLEPAAAGHGDVTISHKTITQDDTTSTGTVGSTNTGKTDTFTVPTVAVDGAGHVTGTNTKTITVKFSSAADLGLSSAMHFIGLSTTDPKGSSGATVSGHTTWEKGDVVLYGNKEYVLSGSTNEAASWTELGDEGSYAQKTVTITAGNCLNGGGDLTANRTIDHDAITTPSSGTDTAKSQGNSVTLMSGIIGDGYGHVTSYTTNTFTIPIVNDATLTLAGATGGPISVAGSKTDGAATFSANDSTANTITITHAAAPTTGTPAAIKVAVDSYGHVKAGDALQASDIAATAGTYGGNTQVATTQGALDNLASCLGSHTHKIEDLNQESINGENTIIFNCGSATTCTNTETTAQSNESNESNN